MTQAVINKKLLHDKYGIDWQRIDLITINRHVGNFTIKGIVKEFDLKSEDLNFIFVKYKDTYRTLDGVKLNENFSNYDLFGFCSKKDFEEVRKKEDIEVLVVSIKKEAIRWTNPKEKSVWNLTRFADINTRFIYRRNEGDLFLDGYRYSAWNHRWELDEALDKSGYPVLAQRRKLETKLQQINKNKFEKVRYTKFSKDNALIKKRIDDLKNTLANKLIKTDKYAGLYKIENAISTLNFTVRCFEEHMTKLFNPESCYTRYGSIQEVEKEITFFNNRLNEVEEKIKELN